MSRRSQIEVLVDAATSLLRERPDRSCERDWRRVQLAFGYLSKAQALVERRGGRIAKHVQAKRVLASKELGENERRFLDRCLCKDR